VSMDGARIGLGRVDVSRGALAKMDLRNVF